MRVLLDQIQGSIDQRQYGGLKDCNTSVYLVRMYDSLLKWVEKGNSFVDLGRNITGVRNFRTVLGTLIPGNGTKRSSKLLASPFITA